MMDKDRPDFFAGKGYYMRVGRKLGRTLYLSLDSDSVFENRDWVIGMVDTPELAREITRRWNAMNDWGEETS
jgi:hypothetical protein